jgi:hypothetical protein
MQGPDAGVDPGRAGAVQDDQYPGEDRVPSPFLLRRALLLPLESG